MDLAALVDLELRRARPYCVQRIVLGEEIWAWPAFGIAFQLDPQILDSHAVGRVHLLKNARNSMVGGYSVI